MNTITRQYRIMRSSVWTLMICLAVLIGCVSSISVAQQADTVVPTLVSFSGTLTDINGKPLNGVVGVTFYLYKDEQGGSPLWIETQNVQPEKSGHYSVMLGSTTSQGLPTDLFASGEARWLAVQAEGQAEQARILLLSVPYALKAGDAETVGGLPASAFVLANGSGTAASTKSAGAPTNTAAAKNAAPPANPDVTGKGLVDYIPMWDTTSDIVDSIMFQKSSEIGINTTTPAALLDVNGKTDIRDTLTLYPKSTDNTLAVNGTSFKIDSTGKVTFISGQTFPGTGTITGVTTASGSGLSGGGTTGTLSLKVPSAGITNTMLANSKITLNASTAGGLTVPGAMSLGSTYTIGLKACSTNQILQYNGSSWGCANGGTGTVTSVASGSGLTGGPITSSGTLSIANAGVTNTMLANPSLTVSAGTDLTGGGLVALGGTTTLNLDTTKVPQLNAANTFTGNQTISGNNTTQILNVTQSGNGAGILANSQSGVAVEGVNNSPSGFLNFGVAGTARGTGGIGVAGAASSATGSTIGVYGQSSSTSGTGVYGSETSTTGTTYGVYGVNASQSGYGIYGSETSTTGPTYGVYGSGWIGVGGVSITPQGPGASFTGFGGASGMNGANGADGRGGDGDIYSAASGGVGVWGNGGNAGGNGGAGVLGTGGVACVFVCYGQANDGPGGSFSGGNVFQGGDGVDGVAGSGYAGNFTGDLNVTGTIHAGGKDFKIDHPLDPANRYLVHASVESSEMKNIYDGNVTTDSQGHATVPLPEWFEVLNTDFRYQLTVIGQFAQAIVARKIENNRFEIRTNAPNVEVSWQVTGVRQDAFAKANPLVVEEEKDARLRGFYIHPELYGVPEEKQIEWARHPQMMKRIKEIRAKQQATIKAAVQPATAQYK
jgi:hypothetical protein